MVAAVFGAPGPVDLCEKIIDFSSVISPPDVHHRGSARFGDAQIGPAAVEVAVEVVGVRAGAVCLPDIGRGLDLRLNARPVRLVDGGVAVGYGQRSGVRGVRVDHPAGRIGAVLNAARGVMRRRPQGKRRQERQTEEKRGDSFVTKPFHTASPSLRASSSGEGTGSPAAVAGTSCAL